MEKTLAFSEVLKQGIKLFIYTTLACHVAACVLHLVACFDTEYDSVDYLFLYLTSQSIYLKQKHRTATYIAVKYMAYNIIQMVHGNEETRELPGERYNARNNAGISTQARKATHGLDGQHQDVDRTPRGRVSQNDRVQR